MRNYKEATALPSFCVKTQ